MASTVLSFSQCPKCAKRGNDTRKDNLAEYIDGFHCYACGYRKPKKSLANLRALEPLKKVNLGLGMSLTQSLPIEAKRWLMQYHLTDDEMQQFRWNDEKQLLILFHNENYYVGRNFGDGVKYLSSGVRPLIVYGDNVDSVVLVEDIISAVKVGRQYTSIPMLGGIFSRAYIGYLKRFNHVYYWQDRDLLTKGITEARKMGEMLGKPVTVVVSDKDPKEYNNKEIREFIENSLI